LLTGKKERKKKDIFIFICAEFWRSASWCCQLTEFS